MPKKATSNSNPPPFKPLRLPLRFAVVTRVLDPSANLAAPRHLHGISDDLTLTATQEVFHLGQLLIMQPGRRDRDIYGRCPTDFGVKLEEFPTIEDAVKRAHQIYWQPFRQAARKP